MPLVMEGLMILPQSATISPFTAGVEDLVGLAGSAAILSIVGLGVVSTSHVAATAAATIPAAVRAVTITLILAAPHALQVPPITPTASTASSLVTWMVKRNPMISTVWTGITAGGIAWRMPRSRPTGVRSSTNARVRKKVPAVPPAASPRITVPRARLRTQAVGVQARIRARNRIPTPATFGSRSRRDFPKRNERRFAHGMDWFQYD